MRVLWTQKINRKCYFHADVIPNSLHQLIWFELFRSLDLAVSLIYIYLTLLSTLFAIFLYNVSTTSINDLNNDKSQENSITSSKIKHAFYLWISPWIRLLLIDK